MAFAHEVEREGEQSFRARHARRGVGEGQALVFRPARVVARGDDVDRAVSDGGDAGETIGFAAQRRRQARKGAEVGRRLIIEEQIGRGDAAGDAQPLRLGGANEVEARARGHQPEMDGGAGFAHQHQVARNRHRFGAGGRMGQAEPSRRLSTGGNGAGGEAAIFGMGDEGEAKAVGIGEDAQHHARIGDPLPAGADRLRPGGLHQPHFRHFRALKPASRGSDGMNPEVGLARARRLADEAGIVERRTLVGHQRGARDAAEMKGRLVGGEDAEIDQAGRDDEALRVDALDIGGQVDLPGRDDPVAFDQDRGVLQHVGGGISQLAVNDGDSGHAWGSSRKGPRVSLRRRRALGFRRWRR